MRLLVALQLLAAVSASRLDLSLRSLEQPPLDLCERGATAANLGANALRAVPPCCPQFRSLQVHRNVIRELPEDWLLQCPQLEELSVSSNSLRQLPAHLLDSSWSLRRLQASRNLLDNLPPHLLTNATSLTVLDVSHNLLTELPPTLLETNTQLEELYLQGNSLASIPEQMLWRCGRLRRLWLSGNRLTRLQEALLAAAPLLRVLPLDHNQLTAVDEGAFRNNRQLELVDLSSNNLTSLPTGLFANLESLRYLLLKGNHLRVVPASGSLPKRPISLDLRDNHLPTVEDFGVFGSSRVWLDGNQWRCGCSLAPVLREAASPRQFLWFRQHPLCHLDERYRRSFTELDLSQCHVSGVYGDRRVATSTVPSPASIYFDKSASDAVQRTTTLGATVWGPENNSSLTPASVTGISVTDAIHVKSSLEVSQTGDSNTSDIETTTSEIISSEASTHVSYISETDTSATASTENDSTPYNEITTTQNSQSDALETSESETLQTSTTETDDSTILTASLRAVSPETVDFTSFPPLGSSAEPHNVLSPDNEVDPSVRVLGLVTYSTTTNGASYNSATTDITVSSPIATTPDVNPSQTSINGSDNFETSTPTDESNESDVYGEPIMY